MKAKSDDMKKVRSNEGLQVDLLAGDKTGVEVVRISSFSPGSILKLVNI